MFLFGVNFNFYYLILLRRVKDAFKIEEVRWYAVIVAVSVILIALNTGGFKGFLGSLHQSAFQVTSIITTTGYAMVDFNHWPSFSKEVLVCSCLSRCAAAREEV